ncbi:LysR family transcriptional regulator [Sphingobacterium endophyticum]|uniref:LysR family transcriptional regulator n=1 Tax=Sphingobacterium endophyticum TaxID=2546448 RepID=UPI0018CD26D5|nr:LysR family transcriptional regulator [Sphingobacterium endophyticum]
MLEVNFRIKVFYHVARDLSFTKASRELNVSQPAVSKHIQELESTIGQALFLRNGSRILLTEAGKTLMESVRVIIQEYELADYKLGLLNNQIQGNLIIGASTTIAQYILPKVIAQFSEQNPLVKIKLFTGNTAQVDRWLFERKIGLGFVEGIAEDQSLKYNKILDDQLIWVASQSHPLFNQTPICLEELVKQEFIFREPGSGTNDILFQKFKENGINAKDLINRVQMSSSESIKQYIRFSNSIGILSRYAVQNDLENGTLKQIEVDGFEIDRELYLVHLHGELSGLPKQFIRFLNQALIS